MEAASSARKPFKTGRITATDPLGRPEGLGCPPNCGLHISLNCPRGKTKFQAVWLFRKRYMVARRLCLVVPYMSRLERMASPIVALGEDFDERYSSISRRSTCLTAARELRPIL